MDEQAQLQSSEDALLLTIAALLASMDGASDPTDALFNMAADGNAQGVQWLIKELGLDPNPRNAYGDAPIHCAARADHAEVIRTLRSLSADLNSVNKNGKTPAHEAAEEGKVKAFIALAEAGANLNAKDRNGRTPLEAAEDCGHTNVVQAWLMASVVRALEGSDDHLLQNLAMDLKCPITLHAYTLSDESRPVRLPDGASDARTGRATPGSVLSAEAALQCMKEPRDKPPQDPLNRNTFEAGQVQAFLDSKEFKQGDVKRLALVDAVLNACNLPEAKPEALREAARAAAGLGDDAASAPTALPQYQSVLSAHAARDASQPPTSAAGGRHVQGGATL